MTTGAIKRPLLGAVVSTTPEKRLCLPRRRVNGEGRRGTLGHTGLNDPLAMNWMSNWKIHIFSILS